MVVCAFAAEMGMNSTAGMIAKKGRASRLGERSRDGSGPGRRIHVLPVAGSRRSA